MFVGGQLQHDSTPTFLSEEIKRGGGRGWSGNVRDKECLKYSEVGV